MRVPRIVAHSSQDDDAYRNAEEKAAAASLDPIPRLRARLIELGALDVDEDDVARKTIEADVLTAAEEAFAATGAHGRSGPTLALRRWLSSD